MSDETVTPPKMDPELKARWLTALRSGQYKQGQGKLRSGDECFCCLGVLGDVLDPKGWQPFKDYWAYGDEGLADETELVSEVRKRIGLPFDAMKRCMEMNDGVTKWDPDLEVTREMSSPKSFAEIADWIEANL